MLIPQQGRAQVQSQERKAHSASQPEPIGSKDPDRTHKDAADSEIGNLGQNEKGRWCCGENAHAESRLPLNIRARLARACPFFSPPRVNKPHMSAVREGGDTNNGVSG